MKVKIALAIIVTFALVLYFWPNRQAQESTPADAGLETSPPVDTAAAPVVVQAPAQETQADEQRRAELAAAYAGLEAARRELRLRLDGLKSRIWGMEFQPGQAREISRDLHQGYALLSNPPLLGAFGSSAEIEGEKVKIEAMRAKLAEVEKLIEAAGEGSR